MGKKKLTEEEIKALKKSLKKASDKSKEEKKRTIISSALINLKFGGTNK